ncbi:MAG: HNH endonuclease [Shimia sp.]|uniref:HNH endonuclease n=1 Tax=Shimia sp. TaxID=1954381 RepID=UPI0025FF3FE5|nr:HNH endonuclease signature motif containing protein [Shimia sp.]MCH2069601.1 HNH endonuclease [Shimia sp.]
MSKRSVPEWIGATPDTAIPARVRLRVFEAHKGACHISGRKIAAGEKWEADHVIPLAAGGENRESNLAPALHTEHKKKTRADAKTKAKCDRVRKKHLGIHKPKSRLAGSKDSQWKRKMDGTVVRRA